MGNEEQNESNESGQQSQNQDSGSTGTMDTATTKRTMVRQRLAIALMAVGGALVAAIIWFSLSGRGGSH